MAEVVFFFAALGAIAGAVGTVALRNPFYSVLALVSHLLALAALFLLLRAEFVAAAQVVVYAGAVMVLYVFVVAYVGGDQRTLAPPSGPGLKAISALFGAVLLAELLIAMLGSGLAVLDTEGTGFFAEFGTPKEIGRLFLTQFLLVFELASLLLLIAAVGAVVLARRRAGLEVPGALSVGELLRGELPTGTRSPYPLETQAEAAGIGAGRADEGGW
jgi:NADH:ubiquinone oxidoreductase subunit 6 (subunit J)